MYGGSREEWGDALAWPLRMRTIGWSAAHNNMTEVELVTDSLDGRLGKGVPPATCGRPVDQWTTDGPPGMEGMEGREGRWS